MTLKKESSWFIQHFGEVDSTQNEAMRLLDESKLPVPSLLFATKQIKGRGRHGHEWKSKAGNIYLTMVIPWCEDYLSWMYKAADVVKSFVETHIHHGEVTIKSPNDVLVDRKKIAGVLVEPYKNVLLIGIGVNVAFAPLCNQPTTSLNDLRLPPGFPLIEWQRKLVNHIKESVILV